MAHQRNIAVLVGSLRKASLNRKMANALIALAPASLALRIVEIGALPLYNQDWEDDVPAPVREFRQEIARSMRCCSSRPNTTDRCPACSRMRSTWARGLRERACGAASRAR
jgi:chromate reductase